MSSFTSEEVEFLRARGNVYCAKVSLVLMPLTYIEVLMNLLFMDQVWLGLYDKSHAGAGIDVKDDDALKEFIINKYERKR